MASMPCPGRAAGPVHVYLFDECSARRRGLQDALDEAGCTVHVGTTFSIIPKRQGSVVVLDAEAEGASSSLRTLRSCLPDIPAVALVRRDTPAVISDLLTLGATSIVPYSTPLPDMVLILLGAAAGWSTISASAVRQMAARQAPSPRRPPSRP